MSKLGLKVVFEPCHSLCELYMACLLCTGRIFQKDGALLSGLIFWYYVEYRSGSSLY